MNASWTRLLGRHFHGPVAVNGATGQPVAMPQPAPTRSPATSVRSGTSWSGWYASWYRKQRDDRDARRRQRKFEREMAQLNGNPAIQQELEIMWTRDVE